MKKILGLAALLLALNTAAYAQVATTEENYNLELKYPVVSLENARATEKINNFYEKNMDKYKKEVSKVGYSEAATSYEIKFEDDQYLAIATTYWQYFHGAAHGMYHTQGIVFAKDTGTAVPLKHFLGHLPKPRVLDQAIRQGKLPFYSAHMKEPLEPESFFGLEEISDSYYIDAERNVYLIYPPYALAAYAVGNTFVKLNPTIIAQLEEQDK